MNSQNVLARAGANLFDDAAYAFRQIRRNAAFTLTAVFSLAVGIAAATTAFTITDAFLLRTLPVREAGRLFALSNRESVVWTLWPYASFAAWRDSAHPSFDVAATSNVLPVAGEDGEEATLRVSLVSGNYFRVIGADIALGRAFTDSEGRVPMADPVVVVSEAFWKRRFGGGMDLTDKSIRLNGTRHHVVGVARAPFRGDYIGHPTDVWLPLSMLSAVAPDRKLLDDPLGIRRRWLRVVGRLHTDASLDTAAASVNSTHQRLAAERADALGETHPQVIRSRSEVVWLRNAASGYAPERTRYALAVQVLTGVTGLLLLVACANFLNLIVARAQSRRKEFAIRLALGAGRRRVVQQAALECVIVALAAGMLASLLSYWATTVTLTSFAAMIEPIELDYGFDLRVGAFVSACVALVVAFGLWPAIRPVRSAAVATLAQLSRAANVGRTRVFGWRLVLVAQLALCAALLIAAGLLFRTVTNLRSQDLGFDRHVMLAWVSTTRPAPSALASEMAMTRAVERLKATPGIESVAALGAGLLTDSDYWIDGSQQLTTDAGRAPDGTPWTTAPVGPNFFETVGMSLIHGREFNDSDMNPSASVVVINQTLRTLLFGEDDPVGRRLGLTADGAKHLIVGVVNDVKQTSPRDRRLGVVYVPFRGGERALLAVRAERVASTGALVRSRLTQEDGLRVEGIRPIDQVLDEAISQERLVSMLSLVLCALTIAVGCVGLYALMAYDAARRTNEIGIRLALGATRGNVISMILREGGFLMIMGLACGIPLGILAMRPLSAQLYGLNPIDPLTLLSTIAVLAAVTMAACWLPARAASRIDPGLLLRTE